MTSEAPTRADVESLIADAFHPDINPRYWMEKALSVLRSLAALTVPPPREPTQAMIEATWRLDADHFRVDNIWRAMYDASPSAQQPPAPLDYTPIFAQHDETGRLWSGPRCKLPRRYAEIAGDAPSATGDDARDGCCERCGEEYETRNEGGDRPWLCDPCAQALVVELSTQLASARAEALEEAAKMLEPDHDDGAALASGWVRWKRVNDVLRYRAAAIRAIAGAKTGEGNG